MAGVFALSITVRVVRRIVNRNKKWVLELVKLIFWCEHVAFFFFFNVCRKFTRKKTEDIYIYIYIYIYKGFATTAYHTGNSQQLLRRWRKKTVYNINNNNNSDQRTCQTIIFFLFSFKNGDTRSQFEFRHPKVPFFS